MGDVHSLVEVSYEDNVVHGSHHALGPSLLAHTSCHDVVVVWVHKDPWDPCGDAHTSYHEVVDTSCLDALVQTFYHEAHNAFHTEEQAYHKVQSPVVEMGVGVEGLIEL